MITSRSSVLLRNADLNDCQRTVNLLARNGLVVPTEPEAARRSWEWLWARNPATAGGRELPLGWVLEADDDIVGFYGNIPRRYHYDGRDLLASVGTSWAVDPRFRTRARELCAAYFDQKEPDLLLGTTANRSVGRIWKKFGAVPMPQGAYRQVRYWILDGNGFFRSVLRKKDVRVPLKRAAELAVSPVLAAALALRRKPGRLRAGLEAELIPLAELDQEFDELWRRKVGEGRRLYASRTAQDLRWHFEPGAEAETTRVLCCRRQGRLDGYLVLVRTETPDIGLTRARIADLLVAHDDAAVVDALLAGAYEWGRGDGCHVLELMGLPASIRRVAERSRPLTRTLPTHPFLYKGLTPQLHAALEVEEAWYPSVYDGDTCLV